MLYDPSTNPALQAWLVKTLEPICDAEPEALATYIIALLKHEVPEQDLRQEVVKQLDEFFENGASSFVDTLFAALRSKSYIPYTSTPIDKPQDAGIPIPLDALISPSATSPGRGTKRSLDGDDHESRGPPKGPRLSNEAYLARHAQANGMGHGHTDNWQRGPMDGPRGDIMMNGGMANGANGPYQQGQRVMLPKGVCRDYHLKGFCSRGAMCKYSHDDGAFAPQIPMPMNGGVLPFMGMFGGMPFPGAPGQPTYDPNDSRMDMHPRGQYQRGPAPIMPRPQGGEGGQMFNSHGELPVIQDLTPGRKAEEAVAMDVTPSHNQNFVPSAPSTSSAVDVQMAPPPPSLSNGSGPHHTGTMNQMPIQQSGRPQRGSNPGFRGRGRGGRGTFTGDHQSFNNNEQGRNSKTIVVEKIPDDKLSLEAVNSWFKRFGTVTNVAVDTPGKKALVSFSSHEEARAAWQAEEAVFNNRFVKIFWHRPMEGQGGVGARALQASAPLVANIASRETNPISEAPETPKPITKPTTIATPKPVANSKLTALQEKQNLLEKQIAEQKELMGKLGTATADEKKDIMARLRKLAADMKAPTAKTMTPPQSGTTSHGSEDKELKAKALLDMELEMHAKTSEEEAPGDTEETRESLQEKLARLQAEASALGITDTSSQPYSPSYRGARGRGRGRASFRGAMRGGPPRMSMKLDNRPKALLVKGVPSSDPEKVQAVRSWFEAGGQLASLDVHEDDSLVARFQSRAAAEQALAKGSNIPSAGPVKLNWHNELAAPKPVIVAPQPQPEKKPVTGDDRPSSPRPDDAAEEIGWGNEEDDGMGMGF